MYFLASFLTSIICQIKIPVFVRNKKSGTSSINKRNSGTSHVISIIGNDSKKKNANPNITGAVQNKVILDNAVKTGNFAGLVAQIENNK